MQSPVFEQTYQSYLRQIADIDYLGRADALGVKVEEDSLVIPLFDRVFLVNGQNITAKDHKTVTPALRVILSKYVLTYEGQEKRSPDTLKTFREFKDAAPLISYFTSNTNKTLEQTFSGKLSTLEICCKRMGAVFHQSQSYDLAAEFLALPTIPIILNFNDCDELFPAASSILFRASAEHYLDMECLAMVGTLLAGKLIGLCGKI